MKKVMILTASTGEGHNQAARSLQEKYEEKGYITYRVDFLKEASPVMNALVADGYRVMAQNFPSVYGMLYDTADHKYFNKLTRGGYMAIEKKIMRRIREIQPHIVVSTHPFAVGLVDHLKNKNISDFRFITVVTDFKAHYSYISENVDAYITGSEYTKQSLMDRSIPEDKIFSYGIPVTKPFQEHSEPKYILPQSGRKFRVLIMGGSMGSKDIYKVVARLAKNQEAYILDVVCGKNKTLYEGLKKAYADSGSESLNIHGFVRNIPELMDQADIIVTKPGGLTTTEALSKKLPMIIPFAIPGQEYENAEFLVASGAALYVNDLSLLSDHIENLRSSPQVYNRMVSNMKRISDTYSIEKIVDLSEQLLQDKNHFSVLTEVGGGQ